jgi:hypothetical protein
MKFYITLGMQMMGFSMVGLCLFSGIRTGDYGKLELVQFASGSALFYIAQIIKAKS